MYINFEVAVLAVPCHAVVSPVIIYFILSLKCYIQKSLAGFEK
jgi:hypothetical protein